MSTVTVTLTTVDTPLPSAVSFSGFVYTLTAADNTTTKSTVVSVLTNAFENVAPGTYTASVVAVDTNNNPIGNPVSVAVSVPTPATYPAPVALTAVVS